MNGTTPEIVTEGTGCLERPGDRARLHLEFAATARTRSDAVRDLGERLRPLADPVIADQIVRSRRLWVHNEWRGSRVVGCRAVESLELVVPDVSALEAVLAVLVAAEPSALDGPRWELTDPAAARREAQERAVADARERAEGYAAALGGSLGELVRLSEAGDAGSAPRAFRMAAAESAAPDIRELGLEPEPVRVTARCTTAWEFSPVR